jgi:two-component system, NtrC family, nitrogen regulation sensor histidine kinase NtrY
MMAHEVNNSVGAINSFLQTVIEFGFIDEKNGDLIESLIVAMDRNNSLADFVKNFAKVIRLPLPNRTSTNLLVLIERCVGIYSSQFNQRQISVRVNCSEEPPTFMMDPIQTSH